MERVGQMRKKKKGNIFSAALSRLRIKDAEFEPSPSALFKPMWRHLLVACFQLAALIIE